jgi:hypothetical protein
MASPHSRACHRGDNEQPHQPPVHTLAITREWTLNLTDLTGTLFGNDTVALWSERLAVYLDLALSALNTDGRTSRALLIRICRDTNIGQGHTVRLLRVKTIGGSACREAQKHGCRLVCAGEVIRSHLRGDSRWLPLGLGGRVWYRVWKTQVKE